MSIRLYNIKIVTNDRTTQQLEKQMNAICGDIFFYFNLFNQVDYEMNLLENLSSRCMKTIEGNMFYFHIFIGAIFTLFPCKTNAHKWLKKSLYYQRNRNTPKDVTSMRYDESPKLKEGMSKPYQCFCEIRTIPLSVRVMGGLQSDNWIQMMSSSAIIDEDD